MVNVDYHMRAEMGQNVASRWLTIRMQFFGAFSLFVTTFGICLYPRTMDAGLTGMVINCGSASPSVFGFRACLTAVRVDQTRYRPRARWRASFRTSLSLS